MRTGSSRRAHGDSPRRLAFDVIPGLDPTPMLVGTFLAVLGGVVAFGAFSPFDIWPLFPFGIALMIIAACTERMWQAGLIGLLWGLGFFVPLTEWANIYAGVGPWLALAGVEAVYIIAFTLACRVSIGAWGISWRSGVTISCAWAGVEYVRSSFPWGGLSWGASAFSMSTAPMVNFGPWIGMAGLAVLSAALAFLLAAGLLALTGRRHRGIQGSAGILPVGIAAALCVVGLIIPTPPNPRHELTTIRIAGIQGSAPNVDYGSYTMPENVFENHAETTRETIEKIHGDGSDADLYVWPEDSTGLDPRDDPERSAELTELSQRADAPLLMGTQTLNADGTRYNHALLWDADGYADYLYAKRHPVPFGEYIPLRDMFRLVTDKVDLVGADMVAGDEVGVFPLSTAEGAPAVDVGILICFEVAYDYLMQDVVRSGADVIVVQSNTALFGTSFEPAQQRAQAKVMAVISGRSVVHAATAGPSAIFGPKGTELAVVDHFDQGAVISDVPLHTGVTPGVAMGAWGWWGCTGAAILMLAWAQRVRQVRSPQRRSTRGA